MRLNSLSATVVLWFAIAATAQVQPSPTSSSPQKKPSEQSTQQPAFDRDAFTITRWDLNTQIDPAAHVLTARGKVYLRNDSTQPQTAVSLQISSSLRWASLKFGEQPLEFTSAKIASDVDHTGEVNEAVGKLPQAVSPGGRLELEVGYQGVVEQNATRLERIGTPHDVAVRSDWDRIGEPFSGVRGIGNVLWYPVSLQPVLLGDGNRLFESLGKWKARHSESSFHSFFRIAAAKLLISNWSHQIIGGMAAQDPGLLFESSLDRLGTETPFFVTDDFKVLDTIRGRILYRGDGITARSYAEALAKLEPLGTTTPTTGFRSPSVSTPAAGSNGKRSPVTIVELPSNSAEFESGPVLLTPLREANESAIQQRLVHTVTHGVFYSPRAWIYEGIAHYAQAQLYEQQQSRNAALNYLAQRRGALVLADEGESSGPSGALPSQSLVNATDEVFYRTKAMLVWWMLHDIIGDAALDKALTLYRPEQDKEPSYMQRLLESTSGKKLEPFFDNWVYRDRGLPDFHISNVYTRKNLNGGYFVTITVENLQECGGDVLVRVITKQGEVTTHVELWGKGKASARIEVLDLPLKVVVNDGSVPESDMNNNDFTVEPPSAP